MATPHATPSFLEIPPLSSGTAEPLRCNQELPQSDSPATADIRRDLANAGQWELNRYGCILFKKAVARAA